MSTTSDMIEFCDEKLMSASEIGCRSLSVLHLSDLHISGTVLSDKYVSLIDDIAATHANVKNIVIVVTGDIANHGQIRISKDAILQFFQRLKIALGDRVVDIEVVPGNHDINRDYLFSNVPYEDALKDFLELANSIVAIFGFKRSMRKAYGVNVVDCGGRSICFMRTDTSWFFEGRQFASSMREKFAKEMLEKDVIEHKIGLIHDSKNARIKEYIFNQIAELVDQVNIIKAKARDKKSPVEIVVALAHHPLSWLMKSSRENYVDFLGSYSAPEVDVWMCGHAHNVKIHFDNDDNQSMLVLMSGVGSEEKRRSIRRYSMYHLSVTRNVCSVQVRAAKHKGEFRHDDGLFQTETSHETGHYCYPLKALSPGSIIKLNTYGDNPRMEFYADQHALAMMQRLVDKIVRLGLKLMATTSLQCQLQRKKTGRLSNGELIARFLSRISDDIVSAFVLEGDDYNSLSCTHLFSGKADIGQTRWRAHFRCVLNRGKDKGKYRCIAQSGKSTKWRGTEEEVGIHDVEWESLVHGADSHPRKTMIRSVNDKPTSAKTVWDDYMTTIPNIDGNATKIDREKRPIMTFGLSSKSKNYESSVLACRFLYLLEFFDINKIVSLCVKEYLSTMNFFPIDLLK